MPHRRLMAERALQAIQAIVRTVNVSTKSLQQGQGISESQLVVLERLKDREAPSLSELAQRIATDQSTASVVVKRLVERRLVAREPVTGDKRKVKIILTDDGLRVLESAPPSVGTRLRDGLAGFADADCLALVTLLERWLTAAGIRRRAIG